MTKINLYLITILSLIIISATPLSAQLCSNEVCFSQSYEIAGQKLTLRGVSTHRYWGFKLFTAGLYTADTSSSFDKLGSSPVLLLLEYRRDFKPENFRDSSEKYMKKNPLIPFDSVKSRWEEINKLYTEVKEKDRYGILYIPGKGIELYLNNQPAGAVQGDNFAKSYLAVWLSPWGLSQSFADELWGKSD